LEKSKITGLKLQLSLLRGRGSSEMLEKVGKSNTGIVQYAIRLRYFRKHKLNDPKGKEEEKKPVCLPSGASILTVTMHSDVWSSCSHSADFHASSRDVSRQIHFAFRGHHLALTLASFYSTRLLYYLGLRKGRYTKRLASSDHLKQ
jgi:hypothetical protein